MSAYTEGLQQRFWARVARGNPEQCWPWQGFTKPSGHGLTSYQSDPIHAHRKAWILTHGPIRGDLCVNHRCDNAACCNPAHLYLGTRADNMIDRWAQVPAAHRAPYGRPFSLSAQQMGELVQMRLSGATLKECAAKFDVHISTVVRYITARRRERIEKLRAVRLGHANPTDV